WNAALQLGQVVLLTIVGIGIVRPIVGGDWPKGPVYLGFDLDVLRVLVARFLVFVVPLAITLAAVLVFVALGVIVGLIASSSKEVGALAGRILMSIAIVTLITLSIWITLRLSLIVPASVAGHKIGFMDSIEMTKGHVWHLLGFFILVALPLIFLSIAL